MITREVKPMEWIDVCDISDVDVDYPKAAEVNGIKMGIFKIEEDFFAIENVCPHAFALLTEGFIDSNTVECPLHEAIFDIRTGELKSGPGCRSLNTFPVRISGQKIQVKLMN